MDVLLTFFWIGIASLAAVGVVVALATGAK